MAATTCHILIEQGAHFVFTARFFASVVVSVPVNRSAVPVPIRVEPLEEPVFVGDVLLAPSVSLVVAANAAAGSRLITVESVPTEICANTVFAGNPIDLTDSVFESEVRDAIYDQQIASMTCTVLDQLDAESKGTVVLELSDAQTRVTEPTVTLANPAWFALKQQAESRQIPMQSAIQQITPRSELFGLSYAWDLEWLLDGRTTRCFEGRAFCTPEATK